MKSTMKMMRAWMVGLLLLVLGGAEWASAQPQVTRGGALKKRAYQTYAAMTLYVDPTGSDSNACTASGTSACLTFGAALLKVPKNIRHLVTINVAAGTYAETMRLQGFYIEGASNAASTAALTIAGTQANVTPTTGTATGTLTGYAAGTGGLHPIATDSGATWTVNDFRGRFLQITGGTGSGQYIPIVSNTATAISTASNFTTAPAAGSTYAIVSPGVSFTTGTGLVRGMTGAGNITISDVTFAPSTGTNAFQVYGNQTPMTLTRVRLVAGTGFSGIANNTGTTVPPAFTSSLRINQSYIGGNSGGIAVPQGQTVLTGVFVHCISGACGGAGVFNGLRSSALTAFTGTVLGGFAGGLVLMNSPMGISSTGLWLDCTTAITAINSQAISDSSATFLGGGWAQNTGPFIDSCTNGYVLQSPSLSYIDNGTVFTNTTNAVVLTAGARAVIEAGATFTGGTNFLTLDGTVYTDADLTTFTRITGPQGSYATRP